MRRRFGLTRRGRTFRERRLGRSYQDIEDPRTIAEEWSEVDDAVLCSAANEGIAAAFEALYQRHRTWVLRLALPLVRDDEEALAIFQETFLLWFSRFPGFEPRSSVRAHLYSLLRARAASLRHRRRQVISLEDFRRRKGRERTSSGREASLRPLFEHASRAATGPGVDEPFVKSLPEELREIARLRFTAGLTASEIVDALNLPLDTVRTRIAALLDRLAPADSRESRGISETGHRESPHPTLLEIEAVRSGDPDLTADARKDDRNLDRVRTHLDRCAGCAHLVRVFEEEAVRNRLVRPLEVPDDVERAILLEADVRAAAIVRRAAGSDLEEPMSFAGALGEADPGPSAHHAGGRDPIFSSRLGTVATAGGVTAAEGTVERTRPGRAGISGTVMVVLAAACLVAAALFVGGLHDGETPDPPPAAHPQDLTPPWLLDE